MSDLDNRLNEYATKCNEINSKEYKNFGELETEYCALINEGNSIRKYIIENPNECDENSYKILTNQSQDISLMDEKFKCLFNIMYLTKSLFEKYSEYVQQLIKEQNYQEALNIYEQMFKFSGNYWYKKEQANIYYQIFGDVKKAFDIYESIEPFLSNTADYWWQFSEIQAANNNIFRQVLCIQKAIDIELANAEVA